MNSENYDCIVVGGGAAGLSAALSLGRARRLTLVIDAGQQSNLVAHGIGGLLGHDRLPPAELYATGRRELGEYPTVTVRAGQVVSVESADGGFLVTLADGAVSQARRLLLATGMQYRYPEVPGMAPRWGETVFHCPFCHGWEVRGRPLAVFGGPPIVVHQALLLTSWSDDVTVLIAGASDLDESDRDRLTAAGVSIDERPVAELLGPGRSLEAVRFTDGEERRCQGMLVATTLHQRSDLARHLGLAFAPPDPLSTESLVIDPQHRTSLTGVFAAGDTTAGPPSVARAVAAGNFAGAMVVMSLVTG
jgi:thioredoxin reductase